MFPSVSDPQTGLPIGRPVDVTPAVRPTPDTILEGRHVRLVALDPQQHAEALFDAATAPGSEALWLYMADGPFPNRAAFERYVEAKAASADPLFLAVTDRRTGEALGHAAFMRIDPANRVVEVGNVLFTPRLQRTPAATETIYLMARHAFEEAGYRRFEWKCNALNAPSRRAAARFGFTQEGVFRSHMIVKGRSRDTAWFSMTDDEWPSRKAEFERWLAPDNFDGTGRQRLALSDLTSRELFADGHRLRRAELADAPGFQALQEAAYGPNRAILGVEPVPLLISANDVLGRYETWLLEEDGTLIGALALDPRPGELELWSVSVAPARHDGGLGRTLLHAAEARARALGIVTLRLFTGDKLTKNVEWYRRRGYVIERVEDLPDRRLVHMTKTLTR